MQTLRQALKNSPARLTFLAITALLITAPAHAEGPMNVDDAGTLDKGGMKVEAVLGKDDRERSAEALFGFSFIEHLEMEIGLARATDHATDPDSRARGVGFGAKWVPYQNDTGWSLGARVDVGRTRIHDRETPEKFTERSWSVSGLASYRWEGGQVLHLNLGSARTRAQGESETLGTWGVGYEHPLFDRLQLTMEIFGEEHARPDKAIGLRYEIVDGLKVSGAVGRGSERSFGQVGVAWEF